jgi:hypothetical protein
MIIADEQRYKMYNNTGLIKPILMSEKDVECRAVLELEEWNSRAAR